MLIARLEAAYWQFCRLQYKTFPCVPSAKLFLQSHALVLSSSGGGLLFFMNSLAAFCKAAFAH
jgi:hypothetical protein